jgi:hypothetical protein
VVDKERRKGGWLPLLLGAGAGAVLLYFATKRPTKRTVREGVDTPFTVRVTNQSTRVGVPTAITVSLDVGVSRDAGGYFYPVEVRDITLAAGEARTFSYTMKIPGGTAGTTGKLFAALFTPASVEFARAEVALRVTS